MTTLFLEPLDVLFLRGNKLFGDPGSFGESLVPPWPSVAAGALRSRMLVDAGIDAAAFARGEARHPELGAPDAPGSFTVTAFSLARRKASGAVEILVAPPADIVIGMEGDLPIVNRLQPTRLHEKIQSSAPLPLAAVLAEKTRGKPQSGYWFAETGWRKYLGGQTPDADDLVQTSALWGFDFRVGVGLDAPTRRASDGRLFSVQAVAMRDGVGFLATVAGANPPRAGSVRLGGDGRAAAVHGIDWTPPEPDYAAIAQSRRCRLVLTTPGLFEHGWLPTGAVPEQRRDDGAIRFALHGVTGWIVGAAVPRFEVVSGWDLANWAPKSAQRAAPTGCVYWIEDLQATPEVLRKLAAQGLWSEEGQDTARRAEGFNRFTWARWP
jgi:CRISPR-associated protein Cmr3